ncbi:MAG TPA: hypothetical protein VN083_11675, partial [Vicinamibacteria bacterium]|nr:hypothetical protein [Vicinamibacteria bacterium]
EQSQGSGGRALRVSATLVSASLGLALATTRRFPLPTREDAATASFFYGVVQAQVTTTGKPLLAVTPEYAYFYVHQPVEVEGSGFRYRAEAGAPGTEGVLAKVERGAYGLIVELPSRLPGGAFRAALVWNYHPILACRLGFFYGQDVYFLHVPRDSEPRFLPPAEARCGPFSELDALLRRK